MNAQQILNNITDELLEQRIEIFNSSDVCKDNIIDGLVTTSETMNQVTKNINEHAEKVCEKYDVDLNKVRGINKFNENTIARFEKRLSA